MSLTSQFKSNPQAFLASTVIVVPERTDTATGSPGLYKFMLKAYGSNSATLEIQGDSSGDSIDAYYLPWKLSSATTMDLADKADFFFTSEMTNCRFSILADSTKTPKVAHVAGNTKKSDRNQWEVDSGFVDQGSKGRARRFSVSGSVGRNATHEYGGGSYSSAFVFGQRNGDGDWKFYAQVVKGCMAESIDVSQDLKILKFPKSDTLVSEL